MPLNHTYFYGRVYGPSHYNGCPIKLLTPARNKRVSAATPLPEACSKRRKRSRNRIVAPGLLKQIKCYFSRDLSNPVIRDMNKMNLRLQLFVLFIALSTIAMAQKKDDSKQTTYRNNRAPLRANPYIQLPIGAIKPQGWLREMLVRQKDGATGNLDSLYPLVMSDRNGWLGGDGDQWERGPYWVDGLLPLAYILPDSGLIAKTKKWVEWTLNSQQPNGYFGPSKDYPHERGLQRNNSHDWWPKMVMLKVLQQYYDATNDKRVIALLTNYFKYQLKELPQTPLDHWSFWARFRGGDNLMVVYWLYNITGDRFLLDLADLLHNQTFDYTSAFRETDLLRTVGSIHGVNLAQGIKTPAIYYQHHPEKKHIEATEKAFADLQKYNGMAHGLYAADEALHGNNPTQGSELCTAVEMMFSLENILAITGDGSYADKLEKIAFNALTSQVDDDFITRQYFQQANQVMLTRHIRNFDVNHHGTDLCYGLLSGYPCCTANMHQGWPKFTQNLWYATADGGLAALVYSPSEVKAAVAGGTEVVVREETNYPFEERIRFSVEVNNKKSVVFPFSMRVPAWCKKATITVNGKKFRESEGNQIVRIDREWKTGDVVELSLPMHIFRNTWHENSVSVERGPLTYALKIAETETKLKNDRDPIEYGSVLHEVRAASPWNYGLLDVAEDKFEQTFEVEKAGTNATFPWNPTNAPMVLRTKAKRIPSWQLYNEMTGPIPYSVTYQLESADKEEEITLIPYGCTRLRISQFPVIGRR